MFLSVVTFCLRLYFTSTRFQNKAKLSALNSLWPLNRQEVKTIGELSSGRPKCCRGRLIEVQFTILFYNYFGTLIIGRLIEGGRLMQVQLQSPSHQTLICCPLVSKYRDKTAKNIIFKGFKEYYRQTCSQLSVNPWYKCQLSVKF